ncbi:MAG: carbamate kinase, partial [Candidatus Caldarchaeum sp.]|nr:carbamate kinase [Candidatus Caldarchaeum sp.]
RKYLEEGHFGSGSMLPKVLACIRFVESGGKGAIIAELSQFKEAFAGKAGTHFIR